MLYHRSRPFSRPVHQPLFHSPHDYQVISFLYQPAAYCTAFGLDLIIVRYVASMSLQVIDQLPRPSALPSLSWIVLADIADRFCNFPSFQILVERLPVSLLRRITLVCLARAKAYLSLRVVKIKPCLCIWEYHLLQAPYAFGSIANEFYLLCAIKPPPERFARHQWNKLFPLLDCRCNKTGVEHFRA